MADWKEIGQFGTGESNEINFEFRVLSTPKHPATYKQKIGSRVIENNIAVTSLTDTDINLELFFFGINKPYINSGLTIDEEETKILALRDQVEHALDLGKYSGDYILIEINEDIEYNNNHEGVKKFNCTFLHKQL